MKRLEGKIALVTGACRGIGLATVELFAQEGARVLATDIEPLPGKGITGLIERGLAVEYLQHDVTGESGWDGVTEYLRKHHDGVLDILVNNAGIALIGSVEETTREAWQRTLDVNMTGVFLGTQMGVKMMRGRGGAIVNVSSIEGIIGEPLLAAYNASKGGVRVFTKSAALHCAREGYGIRVNSVHPGFTDTTLVSGALGTMAPDAAEAFASRMVQRNPMGRLARTEEIARPILFLASEDATYITGAELVVDGGHIA
jgi:NAD(P)-dependent dehydrogenase (short-subunit alcohol dehydrogenase family)